MQSTNPARRLDASALVAPVCLALSILFAAPLPVTPAPNYVGINISHPSDYCADQTFADVMLSCRDWKTLDGSRAAHLDANGWPSENAKVFVWSGASNMNGTYTVYCPVQVTFACWGDGTISNQAYSAATGFTVASVNVTSSGNSTFELWLQNVPATGVRYVKMIRPGCDTTDLFSKRSVAAVSKFSGIRFMDFTATNSNGQVNWSDRVLPGQNQCQSGTGYGWQGKGAAWEYAIVLCNQTGKDAWICVPAKATDDYIRNLALLWRDGGNGFAGLRSDLKLYVEYSNELWNFASAFQQSAYNHDAAQAEVAAGNSPLAFDGNTDEWNVTGRRIGKRGAEVSTIFRSVFGDGQMMSRIRPVIEWQQGGGWGPGALSFVEDYYGAVRPGNPVAHPVSYFFYGGSGSAYYGPDNSSDALTIDNIWTSGDNLLSAWAAPQKTDADWAAAYGLHRTAYEAGPSMDNLGHSEAVKAQAVMDPRMKTSLIQHHDFWSNYGGDMVFYLTMVGDYQWGFTDQVANLSTPKMLAVDSLNRAERAPIAIGNAIPATIPGGAWGVTSKWGTPSGIGSQDVAAGYWYSYTLRCDKAALFSFTPHFTGNTNIEIRIDGVVRTTQPGAFTDTLEAGLHSFRVKALSGDPTLNSVDIALVSYVGVSEPHAFSVPNRLSYSCRNRFIEIQSAGIGKSDMHVRILDLQSRLARSVDAKGASGTIRVPLSGLARGTYIVKLTWQNRVLTGNIVLE